jgi:hypothetical protein
MKNIWRPATGPVCADPWQCRHESCWRIAIKVPEGPLFEEAAP